MVEIKEVDSIRIPCGHIVPQPKLGQHVITCSVDGRIFTVHVKITEILAREVFPNG